MSMIQLHILRNYAPSNLNRDEIGAPKTAVFAGVQRGRISSQCLKRTWRNSEAFRELDSIGIRTQYLPELVLEKIKEIADKETIDFASKQKKLFVSLGKSEKAKKEDKAENETLKTKQLMFFSQEDINACAQAVIDANKDVEELKKQIDGLKKDAKIRPITLDIALFGRMITDDRFADVEASLQVAHALSTNCVNQESDYFTAIDDLSLDFSEDSGAGHLGDIDFNSCCYYIYASLDVDQLKRNVFYSPTITQKLPLLMGALLEAIIYSSPSGKQNSFAAHSLPSVICVERKTRKIPISYINAFEKPVYNNFSLESAARLREEIDKIDEKFDTAISTRLWFDVNSKNSPKNSMAVTSIREIKEIMKLWIE